MEDCDKGLIKISVRNKIANKISMFFKGRRSVNRLIESFNGDNGASFDTNNFVLFNYLYNDGCKSVNLGDYVQTLALKNCLDNVFDNSKYTYFDRDTISKYQGTPSVCIFQGWFSHTYDFMPLQNILPVFIGTHLISKSQTFISRLNRKSGYFKNREVGCRDGFTLDFCQKQNIPSYFSRCLTLTFPKREITDKQNKVFFVDIPEKFLQYIPEEIKNDAVIVKQRNSRDVIKRNWEDCMQKTDNLLNRYRNEAKLVITSALHCASPCIAMGVPTILIQSAIETKTRFGSLKNIIKTHDLNDFKNGLINFSGYTPDIERLKHLMLKNLELSIAKELNQNINEDELGKIREEIASFCAV